MPDPEGRLSEEEKDTIRAWLDERWVVQSRACPISGHREWIVADHLVHIFRYTPRGFVIGGPTYPHAAVICRGCGYTLFFNAVMIGLVPAGSEKESKAGEESDGKTS
jgi:hypothetical protein